MIVAAYTLNMHGFLHRKKNVDQKSKKVYLFGYDGLFGYRMFFKENNFDENASWESNDGRIHDANDDSDDNFEECDADNPCGGSNISLQYRLYS